MIEMLTVVAVIGVLIALLLPAVQMAREGARKMQCRNNVGQLALAMQSYHASHRMLPPGTINETGPVVSGTVTDNHFGWIVQILPQLDEGNLWRQFDFRKTSYQQKKTAFESPESLEEYEFEQFSAEGVEALAAPGILQCPSLPASGDGILCYAGVYHDAAVPIDVDNDGVLYLNSSVRFKEITDGRSHTMMIGEILPGAIFSEWYQGNEETLRYLGGQRMDQWENSPAMQAARSRWNVGTWTEDSGAAAVVPLPSRFGSIHHGGANFALADGAVRYVSASVDVAILRRLGNRHDGEVVGSF